MKFKLKNQRKIAPILHYLENEQTCCRYRVQSCIFFNKAVQSPLISLNILSIKDIPCLRKWSKIKREDFTNGISKARGLEVFLITSSMTLKIVVASPHVFS